MASDKINEQGSEAEIIEAVLDAARLLELVAQGEREIQEGHVIPQEEAFARIRLRLQKT